MKDIYVRYKKMPPSIGGVVVQDEEGAYNVYLNPNHTREHNEFSARHELDHIEKDHFLSDEYVQALEK